MEHDTVTSAAPIEVKVWTDNLVSGRTTPALSSFDSYEAMHESVSALLNWDVGFQGRIQIDIDRRPPPPPPPPVEVKPRPWWRDYVAATVGIIIASPLIALIWHMLGLWWQA